MQAALEVENLCYVQLRWTIMNFVSLYNRCTHLCLWKKAVSSVLFSLSSFTVFICYNPFCNPFCFKKSDLAYLVGNPCKNLLQACQAIQKFVQFFQNFIDKCAGMVGDRNQSFH